MPMNIRDSQLRTFVSNVTASATKVVDDTNVIALLAAVGDRWGWSESALRTELGGKTRQQQFDIAKVGLSSVERRDLATLLAQAAADGITFSPKAQNFIEALIGRTPLDPGLPPVSVGLEADASGIRGKIAPGATVSALNMSNAVMGRQHITETELLGTADANGIFRARTTATLAVSPGDRLRVNVRGANGTPDDWLTVTVKGADTTAAKLNIERIDLVDDASGNIQISHNTPRPLAEPDSTLRITNTRTAAKLDVKINDKGSFDATAIAGAAGDSFTLALTDGTNNADFRTIAGTLQVRGQSTNVFDLEDPMPLTSDLLPSGQSKFEKVRYHGKLVNDGIKFNHPRQGAIGNCYEPSATSSVALAVPAAISNAMSFEDVKDASGAVLGTKYSFVFYDVDWRGNATPVKIEVDGDLWARAFGGPAYGATLLSPRTPEQMELWYALREKARAKWKGGYEVTGQGGISGEVAAEILGRPYSYESINTRTANRVFDLIKTGMAQKAAGKLNWAMQAGTYGHDRDALYAGEGVYSNHSYSILDATEEQGVKYVHLRNPWAQSEPAGNGDNDGIFKLPLDKFVTLYQSFNYVDPNSTGPSLTPRDPTQPLNSLSLAVRPSFDEKGPGFMTTAQRALLSLLESKGQMIAGPQLTPENVIKWLGEYHAPLKEMSLESALQASKDIDRLREKVEELKGTAAGAAFDTLRDQLRAVVGRERAQVMHARRD